jgi:hypothetical protein
MTIDPSYAVGAGTPLVEPFPVVGPLLTVAYRELYLAEHGTLEQKRLLGDESLLPRPWDPPSCLTPGLQAELQDWLERVVLWLNSQYVWDVDGMIPACWQRHPHLVHEIAVLADQRRRAGLALNSDQLEEWHRYSLPGFVERMRRRCRDHCQERHQPWPARGRFVRHDASNLEDASTRSLPSQRPLRFRA